jgi:alpha-1,3-rhamnosyl/mannosyltransferase
MKVVLNASSLAGMHTGINRYISQLLRFLPDVPGLEVHSFDQFGSWDSQPDSPGRNNLAARIKPYVPALFRFRIRSTVTALRIAPIIRRLGIDLYHETNYVPVPAPCPIVINVHDLSFIRYSDLHMPYIVKLLHRQLPGSIERSAAVIVPSEFVRREVSDYFNVDANKLHVTPYAVAPEFHVRSTEEVQPVLRKYDLESVQYVLTVGTLEPRKNLIQVLRAHELLPNALRDRLPLVVVGMKGWETHEFWRELERMRRSGRVRLLGYVPDDDLPAIYAGAALFVYPSIYEGFGFPPLEAMASGVPVITSDRASLPEVVGDVGLQVAPDEPEPLAGAMRRLLEDREEANRRSQRGVERARQFTWARCARETAEVYRWALKRGW